MDVIETDVFIGKWKYDVAARLPGRQPRGEERAGWMVKCLGFGSAHGHRPYWFDVYIEETFAPSRRAALRKWKGLPASHHAKDDGGYQGGMVGAIPVLLTNRRRPSEW